VAWAEANRHVKFHLDLFNRLATPTLQTDRTEQTDRAGQTDTGDKTDGTDNGPIV